MPQQISFRNKAQSFQRKPLSADIVNADAYIGAYLKAAPAGDTLFRLGYPRGVGAGGIRFRIGFQNFQGTRPDAQKTALAQFAVDDDFSFSGHEASSLIRECNRNSDKTLWPRTGFLKARSLKKYARSG
jgi:hypothetical protein